MGRSAIFLMGSRTKNVVPVPILVQGGDVVIMSGNVVESLMNRQLQLLIELCTLLCGP
jgi:alkylated DNA repair dioxygenase AlkB